MAGHDHQLTLLHSAFNQQAVEDPYLSGPSDLEEFNLEQHTPSVSSIDHASGISSVSPADNKLSDDAQIPGYELNEASFDESKFIDFDPSASSVPLFPSDVLPEEDGQIGMGLSNMDTYIHIKNEYQGNGSLNVTSQSGSKSTAASSNGHSFGDAFKLQREQTVIPSGKQQIHQPSRLAIPNSAYNHDKSNVNGHSQSIPSSLSPVVKVSQVHRGDSPTRDENEWTANSNKRSSTHLSPTGNSLDEGDKFDHSEEFNSASRGPSPSRAQDGSWIRDVATGHGGISPYARSDEVGPSPKDLEEERQRAEKDTDIRTWSAEVSAANSEAGDSSPWVQPRNRPRAVSAIETRPDYFNLMDSGDYRSPRPGQSRSDLDASSETSHDESVDGPSPEISAQDELLAHRLNRSYPWKDSPQFPFPLSIKTQPESSRNAMQMYEEMAKEMETISHVGTWGSKRLNDAEVDSLLKSDSFFKHLSINKTTIMKFLPKRSNSSSKDKKRHGPKLSRQSSFELEANDQTRKEPSVTSKISRRISVNSKSPTGIMAAALAGQMAGSIGSHNSLSARKPVSPGGGSLSPSHWIGNRSRSKSEGSQRQTNLNPLAVPTLEQGQGFSRKSSPLVETSASIGAEGDEDEDDESIDEKSIFMNITPAEQIVPTFDGFQRQVSQFEPRLELILLDRFATEQLRRYNKLIDDQSKHTTSVQTGNCASGERCFASGGRAKLLPPRPNAKDPNSTYCQFQIPGHENIEGFDDDDNEQNNQFLENSVTPAVFAEGIRMPPVKLLPAEFECTLCFKVKKFQKPSDWTKHIYEDISPFTCTFADCRSEPKSFKRKADWVRHETECHRHLEWWACNMPNCDHVCYRKNNFIQHLVREHRKPDPTAKKGKQSGGGNATGNKKEIELLLLQVEECHFETKDRPEDEPCRFCGDTFKDWRKLMAHLARHMERITLPILRLAEEHASPMENKNVNGYQSTDIPTSAISIYNSADPNLVLDDDISGMGQLTMTDESGGQIQPSIAYGSQQQSHMLASSMGIDVNASATTYPPVSTSYLQPHYTPVHRNSSTYPPMPSVNVRQPTTSSEMSHSLNPTSTGMNSFQLNVATMGIDGPQQPLYQSPQDTCFGPEDYLPSSTSYGNTSYAIDPSPEPNENLSNTTANMNAVYLATATQMQDNAYHQSDTYHFQ